MPYFRMLSLRLSLWFGLALCTLPVAVDADEPTRPLTFGVIEMEPYAFHEKDGMLGGYYPALVQALMIDSQVPYELAVRPLKRLISEVKNKELDCAFVARTHVSEKILSMIAPTGEYLKAGIIPRRGVTLTRYEDLYNLDVGTALGVAFDPRFDRDDQINKVMAPNYVSLTAMLLRGRIDAATGNIDTYIHMAKAQGKDPKVEFGTPLIYSTIPVWIGCRPDLDGSKVVEKIRSSAQRLVESHAFTRLIQAQTVDQNSR